MRQKLESAAIVMAIVLGVCSLGGLSAWVGYIEGRAEGKRLMQDIDKSYTRCTQSGGAWFEDVDGWRCGIKPAAGRW